MSTSGTLFGSGTSLTESLGFPTMGLVNRLLKIFSGRTSVAEHLLQTFHRQRQDLRDAFFQMAARSGKPRGLRWTGCDWLPTYALVRDSESGLYTLFWGINLSFEAIEGGDMEDVDAVATVRDASAVFHNKAGRWGTGGRVLFNMDPETAAQTTASGQEILLKG